MVQVNPPQVRPSCPGGFQGIVLHLRPKREEILRANFGAKFCDGRHSLQNGVPYIHRDIRDITLHIYIVIYLYYICIYICVCDYMYIIYSTHVQTRCQTYCSIRNTLGIPISSGRQIPWMLRGRQQSSTTSFGWIMKL